MCRIDPLTMSPGCALEGSKHTTHGTTSTAQREEPMGEVDGSEPQRHTSFTGKIEQSLLKKARSRRKRSEISMGRAAERLERRVFGRLSSFLRLQSSKGLAGPSEDGVGDDLRGVRASKKGLSERLLILFGRGITTDEALVEALHHGAGQLLRHHRVVEHRRAQLLQGVHGGKNTSTKPGEDGLLEWLRRMRRMKVELLFALLGSFSLSTPREMSASGA